MTRTKSIYIDLSNAPWTMHEFFAGSGLVGYGLQGMLLLFGLMILASKKRLYILQTLEKNIFCLMILRT